VAQKGTIAVTLRANLLLSPINGDGIDAREGNPKTSPRTAIEYSQTVFYMRQSISDGYQVVDLDFLMEAILEISPTARCITASSLRCPQP
jgi:hypothetical protein